MSKKDLFEYKNSLKENFGYSEDMAQNLAIMAESMSTVYGNLAYDAISSCKFVQAKRSTKAPIATVETVLREEGVLTEVKGRGEDNKDLRTAVARFQACPTITKTEDGYAIQDVKKVIGLSSSFNWDSPDSLGHIAAEIDRLINSNNGYTIEGNNLTIQEGLMKRTETISGNKTITRTLNTIEGIGLETGINYYTAQKLISSEYGMEYTPTSFGDVRLIAGFTLDHLGLEDTIREARITKDTSTLTETFNSTYQGGYTEFLSDLDNLYNLEVERNKNIGAPETQTRLNNEMSRAFDNIATKTREMENNLVKGETVGYVIK